MKVLLLAVSAGLFAFELAMAQQPGELSSAVAAREAATAAPAALQTLRALVTENNARSYGFESKSEAESAALGTPMPVAFVRLDALREYTDAEDPAGLLQSVNQVIVPVTVGDEVRSSIVMERSEQGWQAISFGAPNLARMLASSRAAAARVTDRDESSLSVVHVAALGRYYIAGQRDGHLTLTAVTDDPKLQIRAGETRPASELFALLVPIARDYNELPM